MKYLVTIDYNHKKGFEMSEDMVVVAPDQEGAISYLSGLLSSRASVKSIANQLMTLQNAGAEFGAFKY